MKLLFATQNENKIKEFTNKIQNCNIQIINLKDLNDNTDCIEDADTFSGNALIKAKYYYDKYQIPTVSDDSGLVVEALNGAPGVYSKRYSGKGDQENIALLLKNMENISNRNAYFECAICYYDGAPHYFTGRCYGKIGFELKGKNGFGYDPIFIYKDKTFSELTIEEKNEISHRALAVKKFVEYIKYK